MRAFSEDFAAHLASGATTICHCWRVDPRGLSPFGFTDHDRNIAFDGVTFEAMSGFTASGLDHSLGLSIDNAAASGVLTSDRVTAEDIARGRYDGAEVRQWLVNWRQPSERVLMFRGGFGEIRQTGRAFEVELLGLAERLNRPTGRNFLPVCDAALGDARCGVDLTGYSASGGVAEVESGRRFVASGLSAFDAGWFTRGVLTWTAGANVGETATLKAHNIEDGEAVLELDRDHVSPPATGDAFDIVAGCDKRQATCRGKFSNLVNFRGFPHVPGENWTTAYPVDGGDYRGGPKRG